MSKMARRSAPSSVAKAKRRAHSPTAQIELVTTFADQAVIAIENARLFEEVQARTRELARSVNDLKALSDIGQVVSSTLDQKTVLSTVVERAVQLADADAGVVFRFDEARSAVRSRRDLSGLTPARPKPTALAAIETARSGMGEAISERPPDPDPRHGRRGRPIPCATSRSRRGYNAVADRAADRRRPDARHAHHLAQAHRRIRAGHRLHDAEFRQPVGDRHPQRAAVRRDRREGPPDRDRQPAQDAVPGQHEPRAAHAAERHPRLCRAAGRWHLWPARRQAERHPGARRAQRPAPARA